MLKSLFRIYNYFITSWRYLMSTLNPGVLYQRTQVKMKKKYSFFFLFLHIAQKVKNTGVPPGLIFNRRRMWDLSTQLHQACHCVEQIQAAVTIQWPLARQSHLHGLLFLMLSEIFFFCFVSTEVPCWWPCCQGPNVYKGFRFKTLVSETPCSTEHWAFLTRCNIIEHYFTIIS